MITNERQYQITQAQAAKFREALAAMPAEGLHPKALKAMRDGARSQLAELEEQLAEYENLRNGGVRSLNVDSITAIGDALVKARIIRRLTQKALADRLALAEQQIQRYEATEYQAASFERVREIMRVLGVKLRRPAALRLAF